MTERELALRRRIMVTFAETGSPPEVDDRETLAALADRHVVLLDEEGRILMAHPFAAHREGARVGSGGREWWGNCAWDAFGLVAALGLRTATVSANGITLAVRDGEISGEAVFHVLVPARHWWDDAVYT